MAVAAMAVAAAAMVATAPETAATAAVAMAAVAAAATRMVATAVATISSVPQCARQTRPPRPRRRGECARPLLRPVGRTQVRAPTLACTGVQISTCSGRLRRQ